MGKHQDKSYKMTSKVSTSVLVPKREGIARAFMRDKGILKVDEKQLHPQRGNQES